MSWLRANCPRLWLAREQRRAELVEEGHLFLVWISEVSRLERLVAHREMQLVRQLRNRNGRYVRERTVKLREAERALARARRRRPTAA